MSAAWMKSGLDAHLWESMFYTTYTTVRTTILTPILVVIMFTVSLLQPNLRTTKEFWGFWAEHYMRCYQQLHG